MLNTILIKIVLFISLCSITATLGSTTARPFSTSTAQRSDGICATATWSRQGITVAGGNNWGNGLNQFNDPMGIFVDENSTIYVADSNNARIVKWTKGASYGQIVAGKLGAGLSDAQLFAPMDVVVDKEGTMYITDSGNSRVQKWTRNADSGITVLNIQRPLGIALDNEESIYVSAFYKSQSLIKIRKNERTGNILSSDARDLYNLFVDSKRSVYGADTSFNRIIKLDEGTSQMYTVVGGMFAFDDSSVSLPRSVLVDQMGTIYVVEYGKNQVSRWLPGAKSGIVIAGGNSQGSRADQLALPTDIAFDADGNLYVSDSANQRIQKFSINKSSCH